MCVKAKGEIGHLFNEEEKEACFPGGSAVKNLHANAGDTGSIPGSGRSPEEGNGNPLPCYCLGNTMEREAWLQSMGSQKSQTQLTV